MRTREELAWAAGFFEGEGSVKSASVTNSIRGKQNLGLALSNADLDPMQRFVSAIGIGTVRGPYFSTQKIKSTYKPMYQWWVSNFEHAQAVSAMLWEWLSDRRKEQITKMIKSRGNGRHPK